MNTVKVRKMVFLSMMIALGVVISPILRVEGMCPMAHFINITCAVFLGPVYAFICALCIGILRMILMGIPPLALTGAIFGAFLSGMFYRLSKGNLLMAFAGEVFGTGIIGAIISYILSQRMVSRRYERCGVECENVSGFFWKFMVAFLTMLIVLGRDITVIILSILMSTCDVYEYTKARRIDKGL